MRLKGSSRLPPRRRRGQASILVVILSGVMYWATTALEAAPRSSPSRSTTRNSVVKERPPEKPRLERKSVSNARSSEYERLRSLFLPSDEEIKQREELELLEEMHEKAWKMGYGMLLLSSPSVRESVKTEVLRDRRTRAARDRLISRLAGGDVGAYISERVAEENRDDLLLASETLYLHEVREKPEEKLLAFKGNLLIRKPEELSEARKLLKRYALRTALPILHQSNYPRVGLQQLMERPTDLTVAYDIPIAPDQIETIHKLVAPEASVRTFRGIRALAEETVRPETVGPSICTEDLAQTPSDEGVHIRVRKLLDQQNESSLLVLVGHIEEGRVIFHDGTSIGINDLDGKGRTWVFGCRTLQNIAHTGGVGIASTRSISYPEAFEMAKAVAAGVVRKEIYKNLLLRLNDALPPPKRPLATHERNQGLRSKPANEEAAKPIITLVEYGRNIIITDIIDQHA